MKANLMRAPHMMAYADIMVMCWLHNGKRSESFTFY